MNENESPSVVPPPPKKSLGWVSLPGWVIALIIIGVAPFFLAVVFLLFGR